MLDQRAPLDALRERAAVELALAALLWLEAMQLAMVWEAEATAIPSRLDPGSMPTAMGCCTRADGCLLSRTQKKPPFQKLVAFPLRIQRRARDGVVGISG
jgi:hypothetical protein